MDWSYMHRDDALWSFNRGNGKGRKECWACLWGYSPTRLGGKYYYSIIDLIYSFILSFTHQPSILFTALQQLYSYEDDSHQHLQLLLLQQTR